MTQTEDVYTVPVESTDNRPLGVWGFIWSLALMLIPIIGFIIAIIFLIASKNRNRRHMAVAYIITSVILCALLCAGVVIGVKKISDYDTSGTVREVVYGKNLDYGMMARDSYKLLTSKGIVKVMTFIRTGNINEMTLKYLKDSKSLGTCAEDAAGQIDKQEALKRFVASPVVCTAAKVATNPESINAVSRFCGLVAVGADTSDIIDHWMSDGDVTVKQAVDLLACGADADKQNNVYKKLEQAMIDAHIGIPYITDADIIPYMVDPDSFGNNDAGVNAGIGDNDKSSSDAKSGNDYNAKSNDYSVKTPDKDTNANGKDSKQDANSGLSDPADKDDNKDSKDNNDNNSKDNNKDNNDKDNSEEQGNQPL